MAGVDAGVWRLCCQCCCITATPSEGRLPAHTTCRFVHWIDIGLVANDTFVPLLFQVRASQQHASLTWLAVDVWSGVDANQVQACRIAACAPALLAKRSS